MLTQAHCFIGSSTKNTWMYQGLLGCCCVDWPPGGGVSLQQPPPPPKKNEELCLCSPSNRLRKWQHMQPDVRPTPNTYWDIMDYFLTPAGSCISIAGNSHPTNERKKHPNYGSAVVNSSFTRVKPVESSFYQICICLL